MAKNLYNILEINKNASQDEIKKAYRKLVIKHHPDNDKNVDRISITDKFIDIKNAYDILSDNNKKHIYDEMNSPEKDEFYDNLKEFVKNNVISDVDKYIKIFFGEDKNLKKMIKSFDIGGIYKHIICNVSNMSSSEITDVLGLNTQPHSFDNIKTDIKEDILLDINIYGTLYTSLSDKYNDKYRKIKIKRKTKDDILLFVPLRLSEYVVEGEGEKGINKDNDGDIILKIDLMDDSTQMLESPIYLLGDDIYQYINISLYQYLYGGKIEINIFGNKKDHEFDSMVNKLPIITIDNFGMLNTLNTLDDNIKRGNLILVFEIASLNEMKQDITILSKKYKL
jgi:DnaJ-class molecular chaperone